MRMGSLGGGLEQSVYIHRSDKHQLAMGQQGESIMMDPTRPCVPCGPLWESRT
jgi:hypothetical protein